jgi:hypothetical protein
MPYHTGTIQSDRTTYGLGTQYRNIEGLWDNVFDWIDGCYYNSNGLNLILNPSSFSDTSGGAFVGLPPTSGNGKPTKFTVTNNGGFQMFYASSSGGSDGTYSCDDWRFNASSPCLRAGSGYLQSTDHGLFCVLYGNTSSLLLLNGCRLMELP